MNTKPSRQQRKAKPIEFTEELLSIVNIREEVSEFADKYNLYDKFPAAINQELEGLDSEIKLEDRQDLRDLALVTIDGATAKDFDDAVHCKHKEDGSYTLVVAIADVATYVQQGSELDRHAADRGSSAYFPGIVLPMLPPELSENLCSLTPDQERFALVCTIDFDSAGIRQDYRFSLAVIRSKARLTYTEAAAMLENPSSDEIGKSLTALNSLTDMLGKHRIANGALKLTLIVPELIIENDKVVGVEEYKSLQTHSLIEECMLAANVCAAEYLKQEKYAFLYRVHAKPEQAKTDKLRLLLRDYNIKVADLDNPKNMQHVIDSVMKLEPIRASALSFNLLSTLSRAMYTPHNIGHYGLGFDNYTHFTSPIRRYPDLLVHRQIGLALQGKQPDLDMMPKLSPIGEHCSVMEQNSEKAARRLQGRIIVRLQAKEIGAQYEGVVTGITNFGIFVMFKGFTEGLLSLAELHDDHYELADLNTVLVGRRTRRVIRIGMKVTVEIASLDHAEGRCALRLP